MMALNKIIYIIFAVAVCAAVPKTVAADFLEAEQFYIDPNYDEAAREKIEAVLVKKGSALHFYVEKQWWENQSPVLRQQAVDVFSQLSVEFDRWIYPTLTATFGSERVLTDTDKRIAVFFHSMKGGAQGYFRTIDGYEKIQSPASNEKKMLYMNLSQINAPQLKSFFAHEFTHLITFAQKEKIRGVQEETWLNEARAEYAITLLGYNTPYQGSNLQKRMADFIQDPSDSLVEWLNTRSDYASINAFIHYAVDHYGLVILTDSMRSSLTGISSLNGALTKNGFTEDFSQVFTDWVISNVVNDCSAGKKYCYLHPNLAGIKPNLPINFLPLSGKTSLSVKGISKNWMPDWQRIIGGNGNLQLAFEGTPNQIYQVPYMLFDSRGNVTVYSLPLGKNQSGRLWVPNFGIDYTSLVVVPFLKSRISEFDNREAAHSYSLAVSVGAAAEKPDLNGACPYAQNLYFGLRNNNVACLQVFLKSQDSNIYPEGLVTGYFGRLTKAAVIRFQEKHQAEVLAPAGLARGTGFVGIFTRAKIKQLTNNR